MNDLKKLDCKKILSWSLFFFLLIQPLLYSQKENIRFKRISIEDGLSQVSVNCILQDNKGFMWIGTRDGLNRYDGYKFKVYKYNPDDRKTISDNFVKVIYKDKEGMLWIGTNSGGINGFDPQTECFTRYMKGKNKNQGLNNNEVSCIYEDRSGIIWIATNGGGLNKFDRETRHFTYYTNETSGLSDNHVTCIYEDRYGMFWVGTLGYGLNLFDRTIGRFNHYIHDTNDPKSLSHNKVNCIYEDEYGDLWIGTDNGLNIFDRNKKNFTSYQYDEKNSSSLSNNNVKVIYEDKSKILWIGTENGLNMFERNTRTFVRFKYDVADIHSLNHNDVLSIYEDNSGILWIGTEGGLNKFCPNTKNFSLYVHEAENPNSLNHNDVWAIYEDRSGILWIGTYGKGLNRYDRKTGIFKFYTTENTENSTLSHDDIRTIYEDRFGVLWIGTYGGGLNEFDRRNEKFRHYRNEENNSASLSNDYVLSIYEDHSGDMWIGTSKGGLNMFDRGSERFKRYKHDEKNLKSLSHNTVRTIYEDNTGILWIGTNDGLNKFNKEKEEFTSYHHDVDNPKSLSHNRVSAIYEDLSGNLWIGTYGGGLNNFNREKEQFRSFQERDGLSNDVIYGILEDGQGNLWMSTNMGISRFTPKTKNFKNYDVDDGLQSNEFNAGAYFRNQKTGEMFFGGVYGFNSFFPENIVDDLFIPPVCLTDFLISNISVPLKQLNSSSPLEKPIHGTESLTLSYKQNFFSFEFAALHYASPRRNRYKYKMDEWDDEWIRADFQNRRATYTNLPAGNYIFRVIGSNKDGTWNNDGTSIKIKILPPPWKTWWACTLYILALAFIVLRFFHSKKILAKKVEKRTKELRDAQSQLVHSEKMAGLGFLVAGVAHEINNPSSFAHTSAYNLEKDIEKLKKFLIELAGDDADKEILNAFDEKFSVLFGHLASIKEGTSRISKTVSDLRTFSRMEKEEMKAVKLLEGLQITLNLVKTQYKEKVDFVTDFQTDPEIEGITAELNQVFMNLLVNACKAILEKQKRTGKEIMGAITIQTMEENEYAVIRFQDTGVGMTKKVKKKMFDAFFTTREVGEGTGLGLFISYGIIKKHKGRFEVESEEGKGTTVTLYLPLKKKKNK